MRIVFKLETRTVRHQRFADYLLILLHPKQLESQSSQSGYAHSNQKTTTKIEARRGNNEI